jgi:hypothetical protein
MEKCKPLKEELVYIDFGVGIFCYNPWMFGHGDREG